MSPGDIDVTAPGFLVNQMDKTIFLDFLRACAGLIKFSTKTEKTGSGRALLNRN